MVLGEKKWFYVKIKGFRENKLVFFLHLYLKNE